MKLVRFCLLATAFATFPLALLVVSDVTLVERELPDLLGIAARQVSETPDARAELIEELGTVWLEDSPELGVQLTAVGLDPLSTVDAVLAELVETQSFGDELERGTGQFGEDLVSGRRPILMLDFEAAINEAKANFDPLVVAIVQQFSTIETLPLDDAEALRLQQGAATIKLYALFAIAGSGILLALLTSSLRHHIGALFFVGMPALFVQRAALNALGDEPEPVDAVVGSLIAETWLPWTAYMMGVSAISLVILLASYKLFPPGDFNTVPYAKGVKTPPPRPKLKNMAEHEGLLFESDDDYRSLRQLSIVEE